MILEKYTLRGGIHPETSAIRNILAHHGLTDPQTGDPYSESMILGIGGGIASTYILWEFERHKAPSLVLAFRNKANYLVKCLETLCERLGASTKVSETGSKKRATEELSLALEREEPAIVWIDFGGEPYYLQLGVAVVIGVTSDGLAVDRCADKPFFVSPEFLSEARAKVPSFRNRLMLVGQPGRFDPRHAIVGGLQECVQSLGSSSTSFALSAIRKWVRLMTDKKHEKGWPSVFRDGASLYGQSTRRSPTSEPGAAYSVECMRGFSMRLRSGSTTLD